MFTIQYTTDTNSGTGARQTASEAVKEASAAANGARDYIHLISVRNLITYR